MSGSLPKTDSPGDALLRELKVRARLRLKALQAGEGGPLAAAERYGRRRGWPPPRDWRHRQALNLVAAECGFDDWSQARLVLSGRAARDEDQGRFWYGPGCGAFLNHWHADYGEARETLAAGAGRSLLPYGRQYIVVEAEFIDALGLAREPMAGADLVAGYGSAFWQARCRERLAALRA